MTKISNLIAQLQREMGSHRDLKMRIVISFNRSAARSMHASMAHGMKGQSGAKILEAAGLSPDVFGSRRSQPSRLRLRENSLTFSAPMGSLNDLANHPNVATLRPARIHHAHMDDVTDVHEIDASVHGKYSGDGVTVAVLDSGIDSGHPDLQGAVDLGRSRNFTSEGAATNVTDQNGHGTHVAGIIAGRGPSFTGVAPRAKIIVCKVFNKDGIGEEGAVVDAVDWAIEQGADIINYSGGYGPVFSGMPMVPPPWVWPEEELEEEIAFRRAMETGILSIVSAGNYGHFGAGTITAPAIAPSVLAVAASAKDGAKMSSFSSWGPVRRSAQIDIMDTVGSLRELRINPKLSHKPDMTAVGGEVSPFVAELGGCYYEDGVISGKSSHANPGFGCLIGSHHQKMSGTSQSAPVVSGIACLVLEALRQKKHPKIGVGMLRALLLKGCTPRVLDGKRTQKGRGLILWSEIEKLIDQL